ncbi:hypothetical protein K3495_g13631 [Podosphaera aphanis]|nr:hypothetical protein K3495_g13631 [Podosphaera aphanis]
MIPNIKIALQDISQAYTQSNTSLERKIFVRPVPELELKANHLSQGARSAHLATVSQPEAAFGLSQAAQVTHPTKEDIKSLNKCLLWQKEDDQRELKFVQLDINTIRVVLLADSSFANNADYSSRIGYVIVLVDDSHRANFIHWSSIKYRRMKRNVLAEESYALVNGFDIGSAIKPTAENALGPWHPDIESYGRWIGRDVILWGIPCREGFQQTRI